MAKNNEFSLAGEDFAKWRKAQILQAAPEEDQGQVQQQHIRHGAPSLLSFWNHDMPHPGNCKGRKTCLLRTDVSGEASLWNKWTLGAGSHRYLNNSMLDRCLHMFTITSCDSARPPPPPTTLCLISFFIPMVTPKSSVTLWGECIEWVTFSWFVLTC